MLRRSLTQLVNTAKLSIKCHSNNQLRKYSDHLKNLSVPMGEPMFPGQKLKDVVAVLENFAPRKLAEKWDNVGLLVDPMHEEPIKTILLTNDLTEDVVSEAINLNVGLIVTYHPNIFQGMKSVSSRTWKERIVIHCLKNNIAVYSPHTSWDAVKGGVNDWLANSFLVQKSAPILESTEDPTFGAGRLITLSGPITVSEVIERVKKQIGIPHLRLALAVGKTEDSTVSTIALCAGSGSSVLKGARADLYLTGEMLHHDILDAAQNGIHVILCNHSDSERGFLREFQGKLQNDLLKNNVKVHVSKVDRDPLKTV